MTVMSKVKQTLASIKGTQATLTKYSIQERDEEARAAFKTTIDVMYEIVEDLEKRVTSLEFEEPQYKDN